MPELVGKLNIFGSKILQPYIDGTNSISNAGAKYLAVANALDASDRFPSASTGGTRVLTSVYPDASQSSSPTRSGEVLNTLMNDGVIQDNRFRFVIEYPPVLDTDLRRLGYKTGIRAQDHMLAYCNAAKLPMREIEVEDNLQYGVPRKMPTGFIHDQLLTFGFYYSNQAQERVLFDMWMEMVIDPVTYELGFYNSYAKPYSITIFMVDKADIPRYYIKAEEAYPIRISETQLNMSSQSTPAQFSVDFAFRRFWPIRKINYTQAIQDMIVKTSGNSSAAMESLRFFNSELKS